MKCLIVDTSVSTRGWLARIVTDSGYKYEEAESGADSFELLKQHDFDLIFISMYLSDMDGINFATILRSQKAKRHIPLVMITSQEDKQILERAVSVGVTEIFSKKNPNQIKEFVNQFFLRHGFPEHIQGKILYVEDSKAVAFKTKQLLHSHGLKVDHFSTAEAALEAFEHTNYDLVLTDVVLEGQISGYGLLQKIRSTDGPKGQLPVLAMTGFNDDARKIELLVSGANDYVPKPALDEELIARVRNHITSKKQAELIEEQYTRLQDMAMKDQLTGLYNRHFLMEMVPAKMSEAKRHKRALALVVLDVDKFKNINDTYGHATGDLVLKGIAETMQKNCRAEDVLARIGGEEFVFLLSDCNEANAVMKAEKMRSVIEALEPGGYHITASFGAAEFRDGVTQNFNDLFQAADKAVYVAKETGRNKVVASSSIKTDETTP